MPSRQCQRSIRKLLHPTLVNTHDPRFAKLDRKFATLFCLLLYPQTSFMKKALEHILRAFGSTLFCEL